MIKDRILSWILLGLGAIWLGSALIVYLAPIIATVVVLWLAKRHIIRQLTEPDDDGIRDITPR